MIYLDNAATTYPKPEEVYKALDYANRNLAFNAGRGSYKESKKVSDMIFETKQLLADFTGCSYDQISFESSATEALNLIINGINWSEGDTVYVSPFEHNSIIRPLYYVKEKVNINIEVIPFDKKTWSVDFEALENLFAMNRPKAVFLSHISNVTGFILPYLDIFKQFKKYNAITVLDSSQAFGTIRGKIKYTDFLVFAGHKSLYASFGVAGFINFDNLHLEIVKSGGNGADSLNHRMPEMGGSRYEAGSINSVAIVGLNASLRWLVKHDIYKHEKELTNYLIENLEQLEKISLYLPEKKDDIVGIISFNVNGYNPSDVASILSEEYDICVRSGYHCSPFVHNFIDTEKMLGTVRVSVSFFTKKEEIDLLIEALRTF